MGFCSITRTLLFKTRIAQYGEDYIRLVKSVFNIFKRVKNVAISFSIFLLSALWTKRSNEFNVCWFILFCYFYYFVFVFFSLFSTL